MYIIIFGAIIGITGYFVNYVYKFIYNICYKLLW